jgi:hypothetical protein
MLFSTNLIYLSRRSLLLVLELLGTEKRKLRIKKSNAKKIDISYALFKLSIFAYPAKS